MTSRKIVAETLMELEFGLKQWAKCCAKPKKVSSVDDNTQ